MNKPVSRRNFLSACGLGAAAMTLGNIPPLWGDVTNPRNRFHIGMNVDSVNDFSTAWTFVDVFKASRDWNSQLLADQKFGGGGPLKLTPDGYPLLAPGQIVETLMCWELDGHYPAGQYLCEFAGEGKLEFLHDVKQATMITPNRYALDVVPGDGFSMKILESSLDNPVRNMHVWMPGFEGSVVPFHPLYLERLAPFKAIRFMDWMGTNNSKFVHWSDRPTPHSARQSAGVAIEYMIELCNLLNCDPWFCMPHLADDDFMRQFALLVKSRLKPGRKIYVEWSNEVWNDLFEQARWVDAQAKARNVSRNLIVAERARRDWRMWHEVFGPDKNRIVRVASGQQWNPWVCEQILKYLDGEFDAVACSAYFNASEADLHSFNEATTPKEVVKSAIANLPNELAGVAKHKQLADQWASQLNRPVPALIYEGGQGIIPIENFFNGKSTSWSQAAMDCQSHPLMKVAYNKMLDGLSQIGIDLLMAFSYVSKRVKWGSWGHLQFQDDTLAQAPKYDALLEWENWKGV